MLAIRPEQIAISTQPVEGAIPVAIYANQPAGSETITTLKAGTDEFLAKDIGQIQLRSGSEGLGHYRSG